MTKLCLTSGLFIVTSLFAAAAQPAKPAVTKEAVQKAIAIFRQEPTSERGFMAEAIIMRFADKSPDTEVRISREFVPWIAQKPYPKHINELVIAYMAGTIRSQLEHGRHKNDAVAGAEQVVETYQQIRKVDPGFHDAYAEKLTTLKANGKLKDYIRAHDSA